MSALPADKSVIPWPQLALLVAACAVGAYLLLPDKRENVENLVNDGKWPEARAALARLPERERAADPVGLQRLELRIARSTLPAGDAAAVAAYWTRAVAAWRKHGFTPALWAETAPVAPLHPDVAAAWTAVAADLPQLAAPSRSALLEIFQRAALAQSRPALAAELFALRHPAAERTPDQLRELARLWKSAAAPAQALAALGDSPPAEFATLRVDLLRQLGSSGAAFDLRRAEIERTAPADLTAAALAELAVLAAESGQPGAAVPALERFLRAQPSDHATRRRLRDALVAAGRNAEALAPAQALAALAPPSPEDLRTLGRIAEWSGHPAIAFDAWLQLALAVGDLPAVDRLVALNPGLFRYNDLLSALEHVVPVPGAPDYTLRLARLETTLGRYDAAQKYYALFLAAVPGERAVMVEFGRLLTDLNLYSDAERWLRAAEAAGSAPDPDLQLALAELLVLQARHPEALAAFAQISLTAPSDKSIEAYLRLAQSLGRYDDLIRALRARLARAAVPDPRDFVVLAHAYETLGEPARRLAVFEEALARLPANDEVRLLLANTHSAAKNFAKAQSVLAAHTRLREDPEAAALYLELMRLNNDVPAERTFLREPLPAATAADETVRERLAVAREAHRDYAEAERLWRGLLAERPEDIERLAALARVLLLRGHPGEARALLAPILRRPTPAALKLAAEISTAAGLHRDAERYQLAYLEALPAAGHTDWSALGDIRLTRGDRTGAKRAYAESLRRLHAGLAPTGGAP